MAFRLPLLAGLPATVAGATLAFSLLGVVGLGACSVETTRYSSPESLKGKSVPEPPGGGQQIVESNVQDRACETPVTPDPNCTVKWSELYTTYIKGQWKCTEATCHGGTTEPKISATDAALARKQLANYVLKIDRPRTPLKYYVDACSRDPNVSSFVCNIRVDTAATCGASMPLSGLNNITVTPPTTADMDKFKLWLACGAPAN